MFPAHFDAMTPMLQADFAWMAAVALAGVAAVAWLVARDELRSCQPRRGVTLSALLADAREAA